MNEKEKEYEVLKKQFNVAYDYIKSIGTFESDLILRKIADIQMSHFIKDNDD